MNWPKIPENPKKVFYSGLNSKKLDKRRNFPEESFLSENFANIFNLSPEEKSSGADYKIVPEAVTDEATEAIIETVCEAAPNEVSETVCEATPNEASETACHPIPIEISEEKESSKWFNPIDDLLRFYILNTRRRKGDRD